MVHIFSRIISEELTGWNWHERNYRRSIWWSTKDVNRKKYPQIFRSLRILMEEILRPLAVVLMDVLEGKSKSSRTTKLWVHELFKSLFLCLLLIWYHFSLQQAMQIMQGENFFLSAAWKTMFTPLSWKRSILSRFLPLYGQEYDQIWELRCYITESANERQGVLGKQQIWKLWKYGITA